MTYIIVGLAVSALGALWFVIRDWRAPEATRLRERLAEEFEAEKKEVKPGSPLFKNLERVVLTTSQQANAPAPAPEVSLNARVVKWLEQAGIALTPTQVYAISIGLGILLGAALSWMRGPILGLSGIVIGCGAPWWFVWLRRSSRREKMVRQLPSVFDLMARAVRAGQSVPQALQAVSDSFKGPLGMEFSRCQKQLNLGLAPEIAFAELAERTDILEMRIFTMALVIQRQIGGSLAETMDRLASMVRTRLSLRQQVRSLTAEGRLQGWTLVVLPFFLFAAMLIINRPYAEVLLEHGRLIGLAMVSMLVGILWIRRIVNFEA